MPLGGWRWSNIKGHCILINNSWLHDAFWHGCLFLFSGIGIPNDSNRLSGNSLVCSLRHVVHACLLQWFGVSQSTVIDGMRRGGGRPAAFFMLIHCMANLWCQLVGQITNSPCDATCHLCLATNLSQTGYCSQHCDLPRAQSGAHFVSTNTHKDRNSNGAVFCCPYFASVWSLPL